MVVALASASAQRRTIHLTGPQESIPTGTGSQRR
jgi:hypothetical protein